MARWRVREYVWALYTDGKRMGKRYEAEEVIEAESVLLVDSSLHFFNSYDRYGNPITEALRYKGEWFAVDRIEDQQEATVELATSVELTEAGWYVSHDEVAQPELA